MKIVNAHEKQDFPPKSGTVDTYGTLVHVICPSLAWSPSRPLSYVLCLHVLHKTVFSLDVLCPSPLSRLSHSVVSLSVLTCYAYPTPRLSGLVAACTLPGCLLPMFLVHTPQPVMSCLQRHSATAQIDPSFPQCRLCSVSPWNVCSSSWYGSELTWLRRTYSVCSPGSPTDVSLPRWWRPVPGALGWPSAMYATAACEHSEVILLGRTSRTCAL